MSTVPSNIHIGINTMNQFHCVGCDNRIKTRMRNTRDKNHVKSARCITAMTIVSLSWRFGKFIWQNNNEVLYVLLDYKFSWASITIGITCGMWYQLKERERYVTYLSDNRQKCSRIWLYFTSLFRRESYSFLPVST